MPYRCLSLVVALFGGMSLHAEPAAGVEFFEKKVRPILIDRCLGCHGATKQKGSLRLDSREALLRGGEEGPAIDRQNPGQSRLLSAIRGEGDRQMPPGKKLEAAEIRILEQWVMQGATWPEKMQLATPDTLSEAARKHWAFQPIKPVTVPATTSPWAKSPIDRFILAELQKVKLTPAAKADRRTWIRRATFDLTGLPPTPDEIEAFVADTSADAETKVIDRLLASPRYGERWGRYWLDVARYADNKGYVFFEDKNFPWSYTYRDYIIEAFNSDRPYDQFLKEQLAADQITLPDSRRLAALGFLTIGGHFMGNPHDVIDDRIDVVTRGLQGLTVTCARCHDHKYDPVSQADYYGLYGVFRSCVEPMLPPLYGPPPAKTLTQRIYQSVLDTRVKAVDNFVAAKHAELIQQARTRVGEYLYAAHTSRKDTPADDFMLITDVGDLNPSVIFRYRQYLATAKRTRDPIWIPWHAVAELPEEQIAANLRSLRRDPGVNRLVREALYFPPRSMKELAERYGKLLVSIDQQWQRAGRPAAGLPDPAAEQLRRVLYSPQSPAEVPLALDWGFLSLFPERATQAQYQALLKQVESWAAQGPARSMVLQDTAQPYEPRVFERGNPGRQGATVPRQYLGALNPQRKPFTQGSGRLELANEITSPTNPLTARVIVNRVWMHHFGRGIVTTPGDFGLRGEPPSHPALLDYLAHEFMTHGWSLKWLHRQIMTSAVYQQQSTGGDPVIDPENRYLARFPRRRLDWEAWHDAVLAVSGSLDPKMGGPPVPLLGTQRRAVYTYMDRLEFPSLLTTFDVPNPAASSPQRVPTTVSPQALFAMNGPWVRAAARRLAGHPALRAYPKPAERLAPFMMLVLGRTPTEDERKLMLDYLSRGPVAERWVDLAHGLLMTNEFAFID